MSGISPAVDERQVFERFRQYGPLREKTFDVRKRSAIVDYEHKDDAEAALRGMNGYRFGGRPIQVRVRVRARVGARLGFIYGRAGCAGPSGYGARVRARVGFDVWWGWMCWPIQVLNLGQASFVLGFKFYGNSVRKEFERSSAD